MDFTWSVPLIYLACLLYGCIWKFIGFTSQSAWYFYHCLYNVLCFLEGDHFNRISFIITRLTVSTYIDHARLLADCHPSQSCITLFYNKMRLHLLLKNSVVQLQSRLQKNTIVIFKSTFITLYKHFPANFVDMLCSIRTSILVT